MDPQLESENSFRYLLRMYTADNLYGNLNINMAACRFSQTQNYFYAVAKGLERCQKEKWG